MGGQQFEKGLCGLLLLFGLKTEVEVGSVSPKRCDTALNLKAAFTVIDGGDAFRPGLKILGKSAAKS